MIKFRKKHAVNRETLLDLIYGPGLVLALIIVNSK